MPTPAKKKPRFTLKGRPPTEAGAIIVAIALAVIVIAIFLEYLISGKGLLAQRKAASDDGAE